jgi:hypothetical protein
VRPYLEKPFTKIGLVEWLKVKAPSSSPSITKRKKKARKIKIKNVVLIYAHKWENKISLYTYYIRKALKIIPRLAKIWQTSFTRLYKMVELIFPLISIIHKIQEMEINQVKQMRNKENYQVNI